MITALGPGITLICAASISEDLVQLHNGRRRSLAEMCAEYVLLVLASRQQRRCGNIHSVSNHVRAAVSDWVTKEVSSEWGAVLVPQAIRVQP
jgi:hypothetical protein